jgi:hypothetical protein
VAENGLEISDKEIEENQQTGAYIVNTSHANTFGQN